MARKSTPVTFADAELDWLRAKALSETAISAYRGEVGRLFSYCASIGVNEMGRVTDKHWVAYIECLSTDRTTIATNCKPLKPSSTLQAIRITRAFLLHCAKCRWIDWDPRDVTIPTPTRVVLDKASITKLRLSSDLRRVLAGESVAIDEREARRHFALGLGYWGAMSPRELAMLKVRDFRISKVTGGCELTCTHRSYPVVLPAELGKLWLRYRNCRQDAMSRKIKPTSALIANLRSGDPLGAWSIWALMHSEKYVPNETGNPLNPRLLRLAYEASTTQKASHEMDLVRSQVGKVPGSRLIEAELARRRALYSLHEATLKKLRASS